MNTRKKILVVDDEEVNVEFFQVMLSKLGFTVEEARDGMTALEKVRKFHPDLILLDNIMPRMSGWEVTKKLKENPHYQNIPIVMLSAADDIQDKISGFDLGVDDYITKPFNFSEVLARIRAVLRNHELFAQIAVRESRLCLAEELNRDMKQHLSTFIQHVDELDSAIAAFSQNKNAAVNQDTLLKLTGIITEKSQAVRKHIAGLDARIEKTILEWEDLKKNEVGLSVLETQIRRFLQQEQE